MSFINKLYARFANDSVSGHDEVPDIAEWERFINSLPGTGDCIDMAYNRYQCRQHFFTPSKRFVMDVVGLGFMVLETPLLLFSNKKRSTNVRDRIILEKHFSVPVEDVAPEEILSDPRTQIVDNYEKKLGTLSRESRSYLLKCITRYPFRFFFHYFVCKELITHDYFVNQYEPMKTVVYVNERNVATPILKEMYEKEGRKFSSFMHGEYLLNLIQGFMAFSEFYIWDEVYETNFKDFLRCDIDKYVVYTPKKLRKKWHLEDVKPEYDFTYYFSNESKDIVGTIAGILVELQQHGCKCKARPHPRFMYNIQLMNKELSTILIEDPHEISMEQSLGSTEYAIGLATTVLSEAEAECRKIVIDDLSDHERFEMLKDRRFRLLSHDYKLLSEIVESFREKG